MAQSETKSTWSWTHDHLGGIALTLTIACLITIYLCFLFGGFLDPGRYDGFLRPLSFCGGLVLLGAAVLAVVAVTRRPKNISAWIAILFNVAIALLFLGAVPFSLFMHKRH